MQDLFTAVDDALKGSSPAQTLAMLAREFQSMGRYDLLFEARTMAKRLELELPLIQTESSSVFPEAVRPVYEEAVLAAAREAGDLYLQSGNIPAAYRYFRAIGDVAPVAEAIEEADTDEAAEQLIPIAFQEGVHPAKGLEIVLRNHGMCRAITLFGTYAVEKDRERCLALLIRTLHAEIVGRMAHVIEQQEGTPPMARSLPDLMNGRDWLFGEYDYYVDTSHLTSLIPYCLEVTGKETLGLLDELCQYGQRLSPQFAFRAQPPFENGYLDYSHYIQAVLGEDVEHHVEHFRDKAATADPDVDGTGAAQLLVSLLSRLHRYEEALDVFSRYLTDEDPTYLRCPTAMQLASASKNYERLRQTARKAGDVLSYTAASIGHR